MAWEQDSPPFLCKSTVFSTLFMIQSPFIVLYYLVLRPHIFNLIFKFFSRFFRRELPINFHFLFICNFLSCIHFISQFIKVTCSRFAEALLRYRSEERRVGKEC